MTAMRLFCVVEQVVHQQVIGQGEPEAEQEQDGVILAARILRAQQPCEQRVGQQPCDGGGEGLRLRRRGEAADLAAFRLPCFTAW